MKFKVIWGITNWYEQTMEFDSEDEAQDGWYENRDALAATRIDYDDKDFHSVEIEEE